MPGRRPQRRPEFRHPRDDTHQPEGRTKTQCEHFRPSFEGRGDTDCRLELEVRMIIASFLLAALTSASAQELAEGLETAAERHGRSDFTGMPHLAVPTGHPCRGFGVKFPLHL